MKNTLFSLHKTSKGFMGLLLLFCVLWGNGAMGQITYTWTGATSSDWATPSNWSKTAGTSYPGTVATDLVIINKNDAPNAPVISVSPPNAVTRVTISNNIGTIAGATLTINSGATLIVTSATSTAVVLNGGNLINNGVLTINNSALGSSGFEAKGITCGNPGVAPTNLNPTVYTYSGSGALNVNLTNTSAFANSSAIAVTALNAFATYNFLFNGTTTFNLSSSTNTTYAIRASGTSASAGSPLIIGGAGFTLNNNGGLIAVGSQSTVTVNTGTTLTLNSASTNLTSGVLISNASAGVLTFLNKGIINILGSSARSGLQFNTFTQVASVPFTFTNEGTINVNLNSNITGTGALITGNGGGAGGAGTVVNINNIGNLFLKNTSNGVGTGAAIFGLVASEAPPVALTNNGTLTIEGTSYSYGNKFTIINNNNGILNSNNELRSFTAINNNVGGSINFVKTIATATTRQVVFDGLQAADVSGAIGNIYSDGTNNYVVVSQKFGGTTLIANVLSSASIPASGTLTLTSGTGGTTSLTFTSVSISDLNGALASTTTNSGTINTDTASNLNRISGVSDASTGTIAPGGSANGIADFAKATTLAVNSNFKLNIAGNTTAGVDYDQITNSATGGGFDLTAAKLDVTGIYTPSSATFIDIITTNATGTLSGIFSDVIGLASGWAVVYTSGTAGKVQLVYGSTTWTGATSTVWTEASNWTAGAPDATKEVVIGTGTYQPIIASNASMKSLTLNASTTLTVASGFNVTVSGTVANSGTMTLENNANLIQGGTTNTNTGDIIVKRNSNDLKLYDFSLWSSPVAGTQTLAQFSPLTSQIPNRFYTYNEGTNIYAEAAFGSPFATASGYLIRTPNDHPTAATAWNGSFSGVPNNGTINKPIAYNGETFGYNLVGNPYPSTIDASVFIAANTDNIESSLYFWRKTNGALGSAYAVRNSMGGTASGAGSAVPNGTIQVGQGFFVKAKSASSVNFTNAMRVANNADQIFRTEQEQIDRVWLNLTNTTGVFSQALIGYTADATASVDRYDAKYINDSPIALTSSINNSDEYTIQGRPAFDATDVVALNFKTDVAGAYTIALDHFDGVFATGQEVYLVDSKTGAQTNLKATDYTFDATTGTDNARFSLKYQKTLKADAQAFNENSVRVHKNNGVLYVNSGTVAINNIKVFDIQGRLIAEQKNIKATAAVIKDLKAINQVLIVKITGEDNSLVTKKVMN